MTRQPEESRHIERGAALDPAFEQGLWTLLSERVQRYTMGESTSLPVEQVQELSDSVRYCMELYAASVGSSVPVLSGVMTAQELYDRGQLEIQRQLRTTKALYDAVAARLPAWASRALRETVEGIGAFFRQYDPAFFAHQIPCMVDYQLCHEVEGAQGVVWVREYLRRLGVELRFCALLEQGAIDACLEASLPRYRVQVLNLYEPLAEGALCRVLAEQDPRVPAFSRVQRQELERRLHGLSAEALAGMLGDAADALCERLCIDSAEARAYHRRTAEALAARLESALTRGVLDKLLPTPRLPAQALQSRFVDGPRMEPDRLRALIGELQECRTAADKAACARQETGSLRDLAELLGTVFWGGECLAVFAGLQPPELAYLRRLGGRASSTTGWELELEKYIQDLPPAVLRKIEKDEPTL